jgi:hypothetical protein
MHQVPLPPAETWSQFPLVGVIVLCFALAGTGIFFVARWFWAQYVCERDKELKWREEQASLRDRSAAEQNALWREAMKERDVRYERYDAQRQHAIEDLANTIGNMNDLLIAHDQQAKAIQTSVETIKDQTRPR